MLISRSQTKIFHRLLLLEIKEKIDQNIYDQNTTLENLKTFYNIWDILSNEGDVKRHNLISESYVEIITSDYVKADVLLQPPWQVRCLALM